MQETPCSTPGSGRSTREGTGYPLQYSCVSLVAQLVKNPSAIQETWVWSLDWEVPPGEGNGYPLQYSGPENSMDSIVQGVAKNQTQLSDFHVHFSFWCSNYPRYTNGTPSTWPLRSFHVFSLLNITRYSRLIFIFPYHNPKISQFSRVLLLLVKMLLKTLSGNKVDQCVHDYWGVFTSRPFLKN